MSGEARVVSIDPSGLWLDTSDLGTWRVLLQTGPIFGSALRDATGLLRLEDFSSFDFNELAAQLNRLSESQVAPELRRDARVGSRLQFLAAGRLDRVSGEGRTHAPGAHSREPEMTAQTRQPVMLARGITKTFQGYGRSRMSASGSKPAGWLRSSARTAPGSRRS